MIELLAAIAVLAVMAALAFRGLGSIVEAQARVDAEERRWTEIARLLARIDHDLRMMADRTAVALNGHSLYVVRRLEPGERGTEAGGRQATGYRLRHGTLEYLVWAEAETRAAPSVSVVISGVRAVEFRALAPDGSWTGQWPPSGQSGSAPRAVEASLVFADGVRLSRLFALP